MIGQPPCNGPDQVRLRDAHVGEEHLVEVAEVRVAELGERPALDAGRRHVDDQRADALVLRRVGIGAHEAEAPVGVVRARRPHLLAVHDELVADRARRASAGSRGRSPRSGSLMPRHHAISARSVGRRNRSFCSVGAVVVDRRGDDAEPLRVGAARDLALAHLLEVDHLLGRRRVAAAELRRPTRHEPTVVEQLALPVARPVGHVRARLLRLATRLVAGRVRLQPRDELGAERSSSGAYCRRIAAESSFRAAMDFDFSADQEMLRDSVRRFLADRRRSRRTCATQYEGDGVGPRRTGVARPGRPRRARPARARGARRRGRRHGRRRGRARGAGPRGVPGAVHVVGDRRGVAGPRRGCGTRARVPASRPRRRLDDRHARALRAGRALRLVDAGDDRVPRRRRLAASTARRCTSPTARPRTLLLVTARDDRRRCRRVRGRSADATGVDGRADGDRRRVPQAGARSTFTGAHGWRLGAGDATRRGRAARSTGSRSRTSSTGSAPRSARARARGRVREGAGAVRQADRLVPGRAAPVRRHAAHGRARPRGRATTRAGPPTTPTRREAHRAATLATAFASEAFAQLGGTAIQVFGGIGFTWEHDIHLYLQAAAHAVGRPRHHRRPPRRARHPRHRPLTTGATHATDARHAATPTKCHQNRFAAVTAGFVIRCDSEPVRMERRVSSPPLPLAFPHTSSTMWRKDAHVQRLGVDARCRRSVAEQLGLFTRVEANSVGVSDDTIRRLVASGLVERISPRVFRVASAAKSWHQDVLAACLDGGPECVASHRTAAALHGLRWLRTRRNHRSARTHGEAAPTSQRHRSPHPRHFPPRTGRHRVRFRSRRLRAH